MRVLGIAKKLKMRNTGHIIREPKQKWNNILTTWVPHEWNRLRGRPRKRWSYELRANFETNWTKKAHDRLNWKGLVSTYAQKWATEGTDKE